MIAKRILAFAFCASLCACSGGYSFTGGDVGNAETISVQFFPNYADLVKPQLSRTFTNKLQDIFVQQTPLSLVERGGDLQFEGSIVEYTIEPINAQASNTGQVAQNRLTIVVNVIFTNKLEPDKSFEKQFSRFVDFGAGANLSAREDEFHESVSQQLAENILNQSIGNW